MTEFLKSTVTFAAQTAAALSVASSQLVAATLIAGSALFVPAEANANVSVSRCYAYFGGSNDTMVAKNPRTNAQCVAAIRACAADRGLGGWTANWDSHAMTLIPHGDGQLLICRR